MVWPRQEKEPPEALCCAGWVVRDAGNIWGDISPYLSMCLLEGLYILHHAYTLVQTVQHTLVLHLPFLCLLEAQMLCR